MEDGLPQNAFVVVILFIPVVMTQYRKTRQMSLNTLVSMMSVSSWTHNLLYLIEQKS